MFQISLNRKLNASSLNCQACKRAERQSQKEQAQKEEEQRTRFLREKQEKLFTQARQQFPAGSSSQSPEQEITQRAKEMADDFLSEHSDCSYNQTFEVYKYIETPLQSIVHNISQCEQNPKKFYRQVVKVLHPDKNKHPLAKEAFQKLQKAFEISC